MRYYNAVRYGAEKNKMALSKIGSAMLLLMLYLGIYSEKLLDKFFLIYR